MIIINTTRFSQAWSQVSTKLTHSVYSPHNRDVTQNTTKKYHQSPVFFERYHLGTCTENASISELSAWPFQVDRQILTEYHSSVLVVGRRTRVVGETHHSEEQIERDQRGRGGIPERQAKALAQFRSQAEGAE